MIRGINSSPVFFAQPLEIENRKRFWCLKRIAEEMRNFLCDGTMLTPCSSLKLLVHGVGKVFDVKDRHALPPKLLHYGGMRRQRQAGYSRGQHDSQPERPTPKMSPGERQQLVKGVPRHNL